MAEAGGKGKHPQDLSTSEVHVFINVTSPYFFLVAIFHASFHPTKGNTIDWSLKASEGELLLSGIYLLVLTSYV